MDICLALGGGGIKSITQAFLIFLQSMDISARSLTELRLEADRPEVISRPSVHKYGLLVILNPKELGRAG